MSAPLIRECKTSSLKEVIDLPNHPNFTDMGNGTILDKANQLLWSKTELSPKVFTYKDAVKAAFSANTAGKSGWRLPTLSELKSLLTTERKKGAGKKRSYIHPLFNDGEHWNEYWTSTTCEEVTFYKDKRFGSKSCQEGVSGAWFVHFKLGTLSWSFKTTTKWVWVVLDWEKQ